MTEAGVTGGGRGEQRMRRDITNRLTRTRSPTVSEMVDGADGEAPRAAVTKRYKSVGQGLAYYSLVSVVAPIGRRTRSPAYLNLYTVNPPSRASMMCSLPVPVEVYLGLTPLCT